MRGRHAGGSGPRRPQAARLWVLLRRLSALWMAPDFDPGAIRLVIAEIRSLLNIPEPEPSDDKPPRPRNKGERT